MKKTSILALSFAVGLFTGCDQTASNSSSANVSSPSGVTGSASSDKAPLEIVSPVVQSHNFGEFSFAVPEGWQVAPEEPGKTKAKLVKLDAAGKEVVGLIMVDVGKPANPDPKVLAESLAKGNGGSIANDTLTVDGETAYHFTTPSVTMQAPQAGVVLLRSGKCYMIMGAANEGVDVKSALTQLQNTWKWAGAPAN